MTEFNLQTFMSTTVKSEYNFITQEATDTREININMDCIRNGIIKELGAGELVVLLAIASHCDKDNIAYPSQRKLAEITGYSLPTVNKLINKLLDAGVLNRELVATGGRREFSVYTLPNSEQSPHKKTARDIALYFKQVYEDCYGIPYSINYSRELGMIKNKLMVDYTDEQLIKIINYTIHNYRVKWAKKSYPYPTIPILCSWLANAVMQAMTEEEKEQAKTEELITQTEEYADADYSSYNL